MNRYYDRLLPLFRQFLLLPSRNNKFVNLQVNCSTPCFNQFFWHLVNTGDLTFLILSSYLSLSLERELYNSRPSNRNVVYFFSLAFLPILLSYLIGPSHNARDPNLTPIKSSRKAWTLTGSGAKIAGPSYCEVFHSVHSRTLITSSLFQWT